MVSAIMNHPKVDELEISKRIGFMNSGGAPCPVELIDQVRDMGIFLTEGWGMSETGATGISNPFMGWKKEGSIGIPLNPKVAMAVSFGLPDAYRGETVKACIVLKDGEEASQEDIIAFCKEKLAPYKVPKLIEFRDSLPQSSVGKILRKTLRDEELAKAKR
jgi:acyl-CoA synthetase (AMP-forming)/AMP-acid ligase II